MRVGSLCTGIGGFDLGLEWAGMKIVWQAEINEYCNTRLEEKWPDVPNFGDVRSINAEDLPAVDLLCGGYPCQPFSLTGERKGQGDDRHIWPEIIRILRDLRGLEKLPTWCLFENVVGHISLGLDSVLSDLEGVGYSCWPLVIPACAVGARHKRNRVWIMAYAGCEQLERRTKESQKGTLKSFEEQLEGLQFPCAWPSLDVARSYRTTDGLPKEVDRITAIGNSVFPRLACVIGMAIKDASNVYSI